MLDRTAKDIAKEKLLRTDIPGSYLHSYVIVDNDNAPGRLEDKPGFACSTEVAEELGKMTEMGMPKYKRQDGAWINYIKKQIVADIDSGKIQQKGGAEIKETGIEAGKRYVYVEEGKEVLVSDKIDALYKSFVDNLRRKVKEDKLDAKQVVLEAKIDLNAKAKAAEQISKAIIQAEKPKKIDRIVEGILNDDIKKYLNATF